MVLKGFLYTIVLVCFLFSSCNKKKSEDTLAELNIEKDDTESIAEEEESDAIFDEFYEENEPTKKEAKPVDKKTTEKKPVQSTVEFDPNGRFSVQVSCVASQNLAKKIVRQLEKKGYPAYIAEVNNPTPDLHGLYHRIRIGGFTTLISAKQFGETNLINDGFMYWVDNKSNDNIGLSGEGLGTSNSNNDYEMTETSSKPYMTPPIQESKNNIQKGQNNISTPSAETVSSGIQSSSSKETSTSELTNPQDQPVQLEGSEPTPGQSQPPISQEPSPTNANPPQKSTPKTDSISTSSNSEEDEWGDLDEEWGSDSSDW